jgi:DNA-3-methyladenine glycosylase I
MSTIGIDGKNRCFGGQPGKEFYGDYHDNEWGVPLHDDRALFELLVLEGCQAGLSWEIVLKRRSGYKKAFHNFDPVKVAAMTDAELEVLRHDTSIIRNRLKIYAARQNAKAYLKIQKEFVSFDAYLWAYVGNKPIVNHWKDLSHMPCASELSLAISKDLKAKGMTFVGPTIIYSFLQATGVVNDHLTSCWCRK